MTIMLIITKKPKLGQHDSHSGILLIGQYSTDFPFMFSQYTNNLHSTKVSIKIRQNLLKDNIMSIHHDTHCLEQIQPILLGIPTSKITRWHESRSISKLLHYLFYIKVGILVWQEQFSRSKYLLFRNGTTVTQHRKFRQLSFYFTREFCIQNPPPKAHISVLIQKIVINLFQIILIRNITNESLRSKLSIIQGLKVISALFLTSDIIMMNGIKQTRRNQIRLYNTSQCFWWQVMVIGTGHKNTILFFRRLYENWHNLYLLEIVRRQCLPITENILMES